MKVQSVFSFIILLTGLASCHANSKVLSEIDNLRVWTNKQINEIWQNITDVGWLMRISKSGRTDVELLNSFGRICDVLDKYNPRVSEESVNSIWAYAVIDVEIQGINALYYNFRKYQSDVRNDLMGRYSYKRAWMDFAETTLINSGNGGSIPSAIDKIHQKILNSEEQKTIINSQEQKTILNSEEQKTLFENVLEESENKLCHVQQSPHQVLFNLYNSLQLTQLKGYTMMQFSWMLLRLYKKGEFTVESNLMRERYMEKMVQQVKSIKEALQTADQGYWKCDPKHHVEGETYVQFTKLLQGYVENEVDMNPKQTCSESCNYYSYTKQHGCFDNEFCSKQPACKGDIVNCQFIDADMWVCQADPRKSSRRYDWIAYENGRVLGNRGSCYRQNKVDSWWRWLFWHCSYCFCICDDPNNSDRYVNLRKVVSNVRENRVVVGIRFTKHNGIVHLQIQEGQMLPFGNVNQSSIQWRPVDSYEIKRDSVEGKDYITLSYKERGFDLDELKAPEGHVVTGVKFRKVGTHVNLEVQVTPFNFTSGVLREPEAKSRWISNDNTDANKESPRTQLALESPENPLHSISPSKIDSKHDQFLLFTHSDIDLDAAQTTVPFFDAQIVAPQPATLLTGIGVYHKGNQWFGGFIGVKVFTFDYSVYLQESFPELNQTDYQYKAVTDDSVIKDY